MPAPAYLPQLQSEYQRMFDTCIIDADKYDIVDETLDQILEGQNRYENVGTDMNIPWYFIGILHSMECSCDFTTHLHNGDPLTARTVHEPKGRPPTGTPPFTWEFSAKDALHYDKIDSWTDWSVPGMLYEFEGYNGFGYRYLTNPIYSPYLWSYSNYYTEGKFVSDGRYDATAISEQCGAAVLLRRTAERQIVALGITDRLNLIEQLGDSVKYAPSRYVAKTAELQRLLNLAGAHLKVDGKAGPMTSNAYYSFTGRYLSGDPNAA